jgi:dTDP-4-amino-4,6-dideoxygalactose transaminase
MYEIDDAEVEAIRKVIHSRKYFRYEAGRLGACDQFEKDLCQKFGAEKAVMVTTGSNALIAALGACGIGPGDEVLVPAFTFVATAYAVANVRAIPVLVNVDANLGMCPEDMKLRITGRTKAVIPVHMDGQSANMKDILQVAKKAGIKVIEDVAQAMGGTYQGKYLGTLGDMGCYSFNQDKILTCGEGGAVITSDQNLFERAAMMQDAASLFTTRLWNKTRQEPFMGGSMRVSEIQGAIMQVQLGRLDSILANLRKKKKIWLNELGGSKKWRVLHGADAQGDCGTSVIVIFRSEAECQRAQMALKKIESIKSVLLLERPGYAFWQWMDMLSKRKMAHHPQLSPLHLAGRENPFQFTDYYPTFDLLQRALKISVAYDESAEAVKKAAQAARAAFEAEV